MLFPSNVFLSSFNCLTVNMHAAPSLNLDTFFFFLHFASKFFIVAPQFDAINRPVVI